MERDELLNPSLPDQLTGGFVNINWDQSMDQSSQFESALSSIVSSPSNPSPPADNVVIRELIGRLGSICNSSDVSPRYNNSASANTSCYSTPLNSPPKLGLSVADHHRRVWGGFSADPGFAERAARFSCFNGGGRGYGGLLPGQFGSPEVGKLSRVSSSKSLRIGDGENGTAREEQAASVSDHVVVQRKRKAASSRSKPKVDVDEANGKKSRSLETKMEENDGVESGDGDEGHGKEGNSKPPEPPKLDYIHVRARRGQATDSHSLAERVRREKISERMKFLQNLVPGCNKVTGKAVMLDEIINYVQSLQRQVEFLSMKLATVDPRQDFESFIQKDMHGTPHSAFPMDTSAPTFPFSQHDSHPQSSITSGLQNPMEVSLRRSMGMQLPMLDGLGNNASLVGTMWEDDLESVVQMRVNSQIHEDQLPYTGQLPTTYMKVEL